MAKNAINSGRSGTQHVTMVTKLLSPYCGEHLIESYCKESNISVTKWPRYLYSSYLKKIGLSVWRHHLTYLHILKTWISLERKEIFENSKHHFSSHVVYLFMFQNGLDRKDAIFFFVPLFVNNFNWWSDNDEKLASSKKHWIYLIPNSRLKAGVHLNLSEILVSLSRILVSLKRGWKGKQGLWNTTRQLPDRTMAPEVVGQLFGVYLVPIFNFKL